MMPLHNKEKSLQTCFEFLNNAIIQQKTNNNIKKKKQKKKTTTTKQSAETQTFHWDLSNKKKKNTPRKHFQYPCHVAF